MMPRPLLYALISCASLALGWQLRSGYPPDPSPQRGDSSASTAERVQLQERISQLESELLAEKLANSARQYSLAAQDESAAPDARPQSRTPGPHSAPGSSIPELDALTAAQIPLATAEAIRAQIGENRLNMLRLRDQAEREGWINTQRYAQELRALLDPTQGIRERFGDDIYDRYLYASEKPNRVIATAVYPNSTAAAAGIHPGDTVLSYAGENIYTMQDLQQVTKEGEAGESVLVVLQRDGTTFSITLPRGPIGIELRMTRQAPE